jgi:hypothetical protein
MTKSDQVNELFKALSAAQSEMVGAIKDSNNPFFKSKYADLAACLDAIRAPFAKNGLCVTQCVEVVGEKIYITSVLGHSSGQWITSTIPVLAQKQDPQGMGSAISYARRYALSAISGLAQIDDDAEKAMNRTELKEPAKKIDTAQKAQFDKVRELLEKKGMNQEDRKNFLFECVGNKKPDEYTNDDFIFIFKKIMG